MTPIKSATTSFRPIVATVRLAEPSLWQKICDFVSSLFACWDWECLEASKKLQPYEIRLLRHPLPSCPTPTSSNPIPFSPPESPSPLTARVTPFSTVLPAEKRFSKPLEEMREFFHQFAILVADIFHAKQMSSQVANLQTKAAAFPPLVKSIASALIEIGDKASRPLFRKFAKQKAQVIDPALRKMFKLLVRSDPLVSTEQPLKESQELEGLSILLEQKIFQELKNYKLPPGQNLTVQYIRPVLDWLLYSDHSVPLTHLFSPLKSYKEILIDKIFEKAISVLLERKIDQYAQMLEKTLEQRLNEIVLNMLQVNAARVADFFSTRLSELIQATSFSQTFDAFSHNIIDPQIKAYIAAEHSLETHRSLLEKTKQIVKNTSKSRADLEIKAKAHKHMQTVAQHGGEEAFLQHVFLEEFSTHPGCSVEAQQLIHQEIGSVLQRRDPDLVKQANKAAISAAIADNFLNLMLSKKKKIEANGEIVEIDPFMELWDQIFLPNEFNELVNHIQGLANEFMTPETAVLFERLRQPLHEMLKTLFKTLLQDTFKKRLAQLIQNGFEELSEPARLNALIAENLLPLINEELIEILMVHEIGQDTRTFAPLFYNLIKNDHADRRALQKTIVKSTKAKLHLFTGKNFFIKETASKIEAEGSKITYEHFSGSDWIKNVDAVIDGIEKKLLKATINGTPFNPATATIDDIVKILKKNTEVDTPDPIFGDIFMNLLFKIGQWPNEGLISYFTKNVISSSLSNITHEMRTSPDYIVSQATYALKKILLNKKRVEKLLFEPYVPPSVHTAQKLAHHMEITGQLTHDLIMRLAETKGPITKLATEKLMTSQSHELTKLINRLYKKMLGQPLLNMNVLIKFFDEAGKSLATADKNLRSQENQRICQVLT